MNCSLCDNTGWMAILVDGVRRMTRCTHLAAEKAEREKRQPGGFCAIKDIAQGFGIRENPNPEPLTPTIEDLLEQRPVLRELLSREDVVVAKLIEVHIGKDAAIKIKDLLPALGEGWTERDVKASVEKLRTLGHMPIFGALEPPYGYFMPATVEECDEFFKRCVQVGIKWFLMARLAKPSANLVQHLRGQLEMQVSGDRCQVSGPNPDSRVPTPVSRGSNG